jgi:hypothetical protein
VTPVNAAFDQGCRRRRPRSSTAAASSVAPIARAPSSAPNRNITEKESGAAGDITIVRPAAAAPPRRPEQVEMRRARVFGDHPPMDKEHHLASRKCRRESTPQTLISLTYASSSTAAPCQASRAESWVALPATNPLSALTQQGQAFQNP